MWLTSSDGLVLLVRCRSVPGATPVSGAGHFDPVVQRQQFDAGAAISAELCEPPSTYRVLNGTSAFSIAPAAIAVSAPRQRSLLSTAVASRSWVVGVHGVSEGPGPGHVPWPVRAE